MKRIFSIATLFTFVLLLACSNPFNRNDGKVVVELDEPELKISNKTDIDIYYAVFDPDVAAVIDWVPVSTSENRIKPNSNVVIITSDIEQHDVGDKILVFYWSENNELFESESVE